MKAYFDAFKMLSDGYIGGKGVDIIFSNFQLFSFMIQLLLKQDLRLHQKFGKWIPVITSKIQKLFPELGEVVSDFGYFCDFLHFVDISFKFGNYFLYNYFEDFFWNFFESLGNLIL